MSVGLKMPLAAAMAIAIAAVGCGSDDDGASGAAAAPLTKAEFVKQANAACAQEKGKAYEKATAYFKRHRGQGLSEEVSNERAFNQALLATAEGEVGALRELTPPANQQQTIDAMLAGEEAAIRKGRKIQFKATLVEVEDLFNATNEQVRALGLDACVKRV